MKKYILAILSASVALFAVSCADETFHGRLDQKDDTIPVPMPVEVTSVRAVSGGAVVKVRIPDDNNIKGIVATYERNGEEVNYRISRYVDSLLIEGYADTLEHKVEVCSFNVNEVKSEPAYASFKPKAPAVLTVKPEIIAAPGGVKINISGNYDNTDLAVCLLRDMDVANAGKPVSEIKWVEVTTLFTASNDIKLTRRGLEPAEAIYGVYVRDHWGNISDTVKAVVQPLIEVRIPKNNFSYYDPGDDNIFSLKDESATYPMVGLWDGSGASSAGHFLAVDLIPMPCWFTIDLGCVVELSRIATLPRIGYPAALYAGASPRDFEFWGSMNPTGEKGSEEHEFDDTWFCLGKFTQFKPSGYEADGSVGTVTQEDREYFDAGNDFELDEVKYPHAFDSFRYLRVVVTSSFATFEMPDATTGSIQFGEVTPYGQVVN